LEVISETAFQVVILADLKPGTSARKLVRSLGALESERAPIGNEH